MYAVCSFTSYSRERDSINNILYYKDNSEIMWVIICNATFSYMTHSYGRIINLFELNEN